MTVIAMCDEKAMEEYLESEKVEEDTIAEMIGKQERYIRVILVRR